MRNRLRREVYWDQVKVCGEPEECLCVVGGYVAGQSLCVRTMVDGVVGDLLEIQYMCFCSVSGTGSVELDSSEFG